MDDDVEKAADDRADGEGVEAEQQRHPGGLYVSAFLRGSAAPREKLYDAEISSPSTSARAVSTASRISW